jgi:hypothetical protein
VQDEEDRIIAVLAPDLDPLIDATYPDEPLLHDSVWGVDHQRLGHFALT